MFPNHISDLLHLISLGLGTLPLQIDFLHHALSAKNMRATTCSDFKSQVLQ